MTRWSLPDLVGPAGVIANELVANGVDHAGSMMTLRISLRSHHLHLALRDDSPVAPQRRDDSAASGLGLVDAMATGWGWLPTEDGKVVWAVIRI